jgi:hypothetical protein
MTPIPELALQAATCSHEDYASLVSMARHHLSRASFPCIAPAPFVHETPYRISRSPFVSHPCILKNYAKTIHRPFDHFRNIPQRKESKKCGWPCDLYPTEYRPTKQRCAKARSLRVGTRRPLCVTGTAIRNLIHQT